MTEPFARERVLAKQWLEATTGVESVYTPRRYIESLARLLADYRDEVLAAREQTRSAGRNSKTGGNQRPGQR